MRKRTVAAPLIAGLVGEFGGRYKLATASGIPAQTIYAAEKRERTSGETRIASSSVCYALARAWAKRTGAKPADELALGQRLAGFAREK